MFELIFFVLKCIVKTMSYIENISWGLKNDILTINKIPST